ERRRRRDLLLRDRRLHRPRSGPKPRPAHCDAEPSPRRRARRGRGSGSLHMWAAVPPVFAGYYARSGPGRQRARRDRPVLGAERAGGELGGARDPPVVAGARRTRRPRRALRWARMQRWPLGRLGGGRRLRDRVRTPVRGWAALFGGPRLRIVLLRGRR